eukprot:scaffold371918_cov32-Attheya_sp.AAC.1
MESPTAGFVAQMKGKLTKGRYKYATICIDHYSRQGFVYLQRSLSSSETLESKRAFERHSRQHGVQIMHYHADNGRFADNLFRNNVTEKGQTISYCGWGQCTLAKWHCREAHSRSNRSGTYHIVVRAEPLAWSSVHPSLAFCS